MADGANDGVDGAGDEVVWVRHGRRLGLVPFGVGAQSIPTTQAPQLSQDNLLVTMLGLEGLSTSGVYEMCLDPSPGHLFLAESVAYIPVQSLLHGV